MSARTRLSSLALLLAACGGDVGPDGGVMPSKTTPIAIGDTVAGHVVGDAVVAFYRFRPGDAAEVAVFADATEATVTVSIIDSVTKGVLAQTAVAEGRPLLAARTEIVALQAERTYFVRVVGRAAPHHYRLFVYRVNRAPEHHAATLAAGDVVDDEPLETSADIDEYTIAGTKGQTMIAYLQAIDPAAAGTARLAVTLPGAAANDPQPGTTAAVGDAETAHTGAFTLAADGTVRLAVGGAGQWTPSGENRGRVRLATRLVNPAPEQHAAAIAPGDTVAGEAIDYVGDIDTYTLAAPPGSELNVFFQALGGDPSTRLSLRVLPAAPGSLWLANVQSSGTDQALLGRATGRFLVPAGGSISLVVGGGEPEPGLHRGPYRLLVAPLVRAPETAPAALALGQSIDGESIDLPGDVDEFTLAVPQSTYANFVLSGPAAAGRRVQLVRTPLGSEQIQTNLLLPASETGGDVAGAAGTAFVPAGSYRLRIEGTDSKGTGYRGSYRVETFAIDTLPETASSSLPIGGAAAGEALAPVGDIDSYTIAGVAGDLIDITLRGGTSGVPPGIEGLLRRPDMPLANPFAAVYASGAGSPPNHSGRIELPVTGTYRLMVLGINEGHSLSETGPYELAVVRYPSTPEHVAAALAPGADVTGESIDELGDVDDFVLTAAPGTAITISLKREGPGSGTLWGVASDPATGAEVGSVGSSGWEQASPVMLVPAGGQLRLRFYERLGVMYGVTGPYHFKVTAVQP